MGKLIGMKPYHAKSVTENAHKIARIRCEIECANELILQNGKLIGVKCYHAKSLNWTKNIYFNFRTRVQRSRGVALL